MQPDFLPRLFRQSRQSLWLRPAIFAGIAVLTLAVAPMVSSLIPSSLVDLIGLDGVYDLLNALANTLLAVAIFSLGIMASALQAAATAATPRARPLLMKDRTAQNAISTFIGGFIYSIVGIVGLSTNYYNDAARVILFFASCLVILAVILALIRWIGSLSSLGDVSEVIDRLETTAIDAIGRFADDPYFGGMRDAVPPDRRFDIFPSGFGYVQSVTGGALCSVSDDFAGHIHVLAAVGDWVDPSRPLLRCDAMPDAKQIDRLRAAFVIGPDRLFDDDPRYGLVVLSEVAVRALSPSENDPGTALDVIGTSVRVLVHWSEKLSASPAVRHPRLHVQGVDGRALLEDAFRWVARDGAAQLEVQLRLQDSLSALAAHDPPRYRTAACNVAAEALERAALAMAYTADVEELRRNGVKLGLMDGSSSGPTSGAD